MKRFAMSALLTKDIPTGKNIQGNLDIVSARNKEEAIGKYIFYLKEKFPEHDVFDRVMNMEIPEKRFRFFRKKVKLTESEHG